MWKDNDKIVQVLNGLSDENTPFPRKCPECRGNSAHIYIHDHGNDHCGMWVWCSECGAFAHMSAQTPKWWKNPAFIDGEMLCSEPDYLEAKADDIDKWGSALLQSKETSSARPFSIEDRFNVKVKKDIQGIPTGTQGVLVIKNDLCVARIRFIYEDGNSVELFLSQEELLEAIEVL